MFKDTSAAPRPVSPPDPAWAACCLVAGVMVTPYKSLAGTLATRFKQDAADVGGPITEALSLARGSTFDRVLCLEKSLLLQRRWEAGWAGFPIYASGHVSFFLSGRAGGTERARGTFRHRACT